MNPVDCFRCSLVASVLGALLLAGCHSRDTSLGTATSTHSTTPITRHVYPGDDLSAILAELGHQHGERTLIVHAGTYGPQQPGYSFLTLTAAHHGLRLMADGNVTLTAINPVQEVVKSNESALVSHIVYCGDGLGPETIIEGFRITGARGVVRTEHFPHELRVAPDGPLQRGLFYTRDGGGLKIFGASAPTIRRCDFIDNETTLCGGAVSVEQQGFRDQPARFEDCRFENNRCPGTGAAVDVLAGSTAELENCLFVNNVANYGMDEIERQFGLSYNPEHGCGALTVFPSSRVIVRRCTFTGNWNGVDDHGAGSRYEACLFWKNDRSDGSRPGKPYEVDLLDSIGFVRCRLQGSIADLRGTIDRAQNEWSTEDPDFDAEYQPRNPLDADRGYRRSPQISESTTP